ncbi:MAG: hypothetical protein JXA20_15910 [Spirochaetes bacterium]|nr:hypothetical protein [Spirochaetota bacterium]
MKTSIPLYLLLFSLLCSAPIFAQSGHLKDHPGKTTHQYSSLPRGHDYAQRYTPQEEAVVKQKTEAVAKYLQSLRPFSNLRGFEITLTTYIGTREKLMEWNDRLYWDLNVLVYPWSMYNGKAIYTCSECARGFSLRFNRLDMVFSGYTMESEVYDTEGVRMNLEPVEIGVQDGCRVYQNGIVVISNGRPLWVPVTVKEYNEALIRRHAELKKEGHTDELTYTFFTKRIREEMASYGQKELNGPAYQGDKLGACPYRLEGARAIVKLNRNYFDMRKPRTAVQLIILESSCIQQGDEGGSSISGTSTPRPRRCTGRTS